MYNEIQNLISERSNRVPVYVKPNGDLTTEQKRFENLPLCQLGHKNRARVLTALKDKAVSRVFIKNRVTYVVVDGQTRMIVNYLP